MRAIDVLRQSKASRGEIVVLPNELEQQAEPTTPKTEPPAIQVSDADKKKVICDVLEKVYLELTDNMNLPQPKAPSEWVDTLRWALRVMPKQYDKIHEIIADELSDWS